MHLLQTLLGNGSSLPAVHVRTVTIRLGGGMADPAEMGGRPATTELHDRLHEPALSHLWSSPKREALFGVPVEVDPQAQGWAVRVT
jgi:hypothetical protein